VASFADLDDICPGVSGPADIVNPVTVGTNGGFLIAGIQGFLVGTIQRSFIVGVMAFLAGFIPLQAVFSQGLGSFFWVRIRSSVGVALNTGIPQTPMD